MTNLKRILSASIVLLTAVTALPQEALWSGTEIKSPIVNNDGTVTFNIFAPNATKVSITGTFVPDDNGSPTSVDLTKDVHGVWSFTTDALPAEFYTYNVNVDGMTMLDPANVYVNRDVASLTSYFIVSRQKGDCGDLYSVNEVPHGNLSKVWYDSPTLGMHRRMSIYTPPSYNDNLTEKYPVLYLLHGAGGDEDAWPTQGRTAQILDNLIATGKATPMIVVMPNGNVDCQAAPGEWSRGLYQPSFMASLQPTGTPKASMAESFPDIINYVESHYRVIADKQHRAVCGLSMGGGHSFLISARYPNTFDYVGLFSAGIRLGSGDSHSGLYNKILANDKLQQQLQSLFEAHPALYWIGIGSTDFLYESNAELRRYFDEQNYPYTYVETSGGHIWRNWRIYLTQFAELIFK